MSCSSFVFDGVHNNGPTDGQLSITVSANDYKNVVYAPGVFTVTIEGTVEGSDGPETQEAEIKITLLDPCDPPVSVDRVPLTNQSYRIGDPSATPYTHPNFVVSPDFCPLTYTYSETTLLDGSTAISRTDKTFTFSYDMESAIDQTQTVTITAKSDSKYPTSYPKKTDSETFDLTFVNPCLSD